MSVYTGVLQPITALKVASMYVKLIWGINFLTYCGFQHEDGGVFSDTFSQVQCWVI